MSYKNLKVFRGPTLLSPMIYNEGFVLELSGGRTSFDSSIPLGLFTQHCPYFVFLMETKSQDGHMEKLRRKLKFQHMCLVSPRGRPGGLAFFSPDPS